MAQIKPPKEIVHKITMIHSSVYFWGLRAFCNVTNTALIAKDGAYQEMVVLAFRGRARLPL